MKVKILICLTACLGLAFCVSSGGGGDMNISRGQQIPPQFISVEQFSSESVTIQIRVKFTQESLYHIVTDEEGRFISQGWFRTSRDGTGRYTITMEAEGDFLYEEGKRYLLCISTVHPDQVRHQSNNYQCMSNAWFILE